MTKRMKVTPSGASASRLSAMKRKEAPQIKPGSTSSAQSSKLDEDASVTVALVAVGRRVVAVRACTMDMSVLKFRR